MYLLKIKFENCRSLIEYLSIHYAQHIVIGANHEAAHKFLIYEIIIKSEKFGIGLAIKENGISPKLINQGHRVFLGFSSYIVELNINEKKINYIEKKLNGIFFDFFYFDDKQVGLIYETGAAIYSKGLNLIWVTSTDILSDWFFDGKNKLLQLHEYESNMDYKFDLKKSLLI